MASDFADRIKGLNCGWWVEITAAQRGDFLPLVRSLRSTKPIPSAEDRWLRDVMADALSGDLQRRRGRPPLPERATQSRWFRLLDRNPNLAGAVNYVARFKQMRARRYGRRRGVEAEAIEKAAAKFGVTYEAIHNYIHRSTRSNKRT
jgi:hypothetical protein